MFKYNKKLGQIESNESEYYLVIEYFLDKSSFDYRVFHFNFAFYRSAFNANDYSNTYTAYSYDLPAKLKHIDKFKATAQSDRNTHKPYGFSLQLNYFDSVVSSHLKESARTLSEIEKGLALLDDKFGHCDNLQDYIARLADVLGIKYFHIRHGRSDNLQDISHFRWKLNDDINQWKKETMPVDNVTAING